MIEAISCEHGVAVCKKCQSWMYKQDAARYRQQCYELVRGLVDIQKRYTPNGDLKRDIDLLLAKAK